MFRNRLRASPRGLRSNWARSAAGVATAALASLYFCGGVLGQDNASDADDSAKPALPNIYVDFRTTYTALPAGTISIGFGSSSLLATLPSLSSLATLTSPSSRSLGVDVPLTVDLNDQVSVYGGFSATTTQTDMTSWTTLAVTSWNIGVQADIYQQNGGKIPTITVQTTLTRSVPDSPLATTSLNTILEAGYALNEDETRGFLAGVQYTRVAVDSSLARVNPNTIGYVGAYYQWDNNWKVTGRAGVQSFEGAQLLHLTPIQSFTQPILRFDLDRMDDNDNRLFGVTAEIAWTPKPAYQLTLRTPLFLVRN
jgi:hypothetical protein